VNMGKLTDILDAPARQLSIEELLATLEAEERDDAPQVIIPVTNMGAPISADDRDGSPPGGNGLEPGVSVRHVDFADVRGVVVAVKDNGKVMVRVLAGWQGNVLPYWPVSIPYSKLEVLQ